VRQILRMPNGDLVISFQSAEVADTVCRVRASVFIMGVGSVQMSWTTEKKRWIWSSSHFHNHDNNEKLVFSLSWFVFPLCFGHIHHLSFSMESQNLPLSGTPQTDTQATIFNLDHFPSPFFNPWWRFNPCLCSCDEYAYDPIMTFMPLIPLSILSM